MNRNKFPALVVAMAIILVLFTIAAIAIPMIEYNTRRVIKEDCKAKIDEINKAIESFKKENDGIITAADLITIFPDGIPTCLTTDTAFLIDGNGKVIEEGHEHY